MSFAKIHNHDWKDKHWEYAKGPVSKSKHQLEYKVAEHQDHKQLAKISGHIIRPICLWAQEQSLVKSLWFFIDLLGTVYDFLANLQRVPGVFYGLLGGGYLLVDTPLFVLLLGLLVLWFFLYVKVFRVHFMTVLITIFVKIYYLTGGCWTLAYKNFIKMDQKIELLKSEIIEKNYSQEDFEIFC